MWAVDKLKYVRNSPRNYVLIFSCVFSMFLLGPKVLKGRVPIGTKSSYSAQKFLLGVFLLGPKVPIERVPIGLTDEFIGLKNSSQSAQFWFLLGAFLSGAPPVFTWKALQK